MILSGISQINELQDNILRVLDLEPTKIITQQSAWDMLISLDLINIKDPVKTKQTKEHFLIAFLTMSSTYNNVFLKVRNNKYYLMSDISAFGQTIVNNNNYLDDIVLEKDELCKVLINDDCLLDDKIIDNDGNTVLHYLANEGKLDLLEKCLNKQDDSLCLKNSKGLTPFDVGDSNSKKTIQKHLFAKLDKQNKELELLLQRVMKELKDRQDELAILRKPVDYNYYNGFNFTIGVLVISVFLRYIW